MQKFVENEIKVSNRKEYHQFRVYSLKNQAFRPETEELYLSSDGCLTTKNGQRLSLEENVIQRCTGVRDIRGRLIYLGDILRTDEGCWKAAVVWGDGRFCLEDDHGGFSALPNWENCEVIGNIFTMELHRRQELSAEEERARDFWYACWGGDADSLKELLPSCRQWLNRNLEFPEGGVRMNHCLPLIAAVIGCSPECLKLLLKNGALPHKKCRHFGETPWSLVKRLEGSSENRPRLKILANAKKYLPG